MTVTPEQLRDWLLEALRTGHLPQEYLRAVEGDPSPIDGETAIGLDVGGGEFFIEVARA